MNWKKGTVSISFSTGAGNAHIEAEGLVVIKVPRREEWGPSVSVSGVFGPIALKNENNYLVIEMQSGDKIELEAKSILMPNNTLDIVGDSLP